MDIQKITIDIPEKFDKKEFVKNLSFVSESIVSYTFYNDSVVIKYKKNPHNEILQKRIIETVNNVLSVVDVKNEEVYKTSLNESKKIKFLKASEVYDGNNIVDFHNGTIGLCGDMVYLFDFFDNIFKLFAISLGAKEEKYPVLLQAKTLEDSGYLKISPEYSLFVGNVKEDMEELKKISASGQVKVIETDGKNVLSPSACFHIYEKYRNANLGDFTSVTTLQSVFRNEGRFAWGEFGRLKDYHVREIVFIGNQQYVDDSLNTLMEKTTLLLKNIGLVGTIESAGDSFILPQMQRYKKVQLHKKAKYEVKLNYSDDDVLSAASFNRHGRTFAYAFDIKVENKTDIVTGCAGYGIERFILAFISKYGYDREKWPESVNLYINNCKKRGEKDYEENIGN